MIPNEMRFTAETAPFGEDILSLSEMRPGGAEIYTYQRLAPDNAYGQLWAGLDEEDRLAAVLLDTGETRTLLTPQAGMAGAAPGGDAAPFSPLSIAAPFFVMTKERPGACAPPAAAPAPLSEVLDLVHPNAGADEKEMMYVYFSRATNAGLSAAFGEYEGGILCAAAQILAKNRRFALIGNLFTLPEHRGRGCAARLLAACEAAAVAEGLRPVLYCYPAMARYYLARGYRILEQHEV